MDIGIDQLRRNYERGPLLKTDLADDPVAQFQLWLDEAVKAVGEDALAMTLATAAADGEPSARVVLLRSVDESGLAFFTNYDSAKGRDLSDNPRASLCFFWGALSRQVRVTGSVTRTSDAESDAYFAGRPHGSQLGAWASPQGQVLHNRAELESSLAGVMQRFGNGVVPRPPHWGGYRVALETVEFWQGRADRLHDRLRYRRDDSGAWVIERLAP